MATGRLADNGRDPSGTAHGQAAIKGASAVLRDVFGAAVQAGGVIGSSATSGHLRQGVDLEGRLGVDEGALRIACPDVPGWGRHALSYGPVDFDQPGCSVVHLLNGHHGSQTRRVYSRRRRSIVRSWFTGLVRRAMMVGPWRTVTPRLGRLAPRSVHDLTIPAYRTSMRVGWFGSPLKPRRKGHPSWFIRAASGRNGDLGARVAGRDLIVVEGVCNVPLCLAILECFHGTSYLVGGTEGAAGLAPFPYLRPVAFDPQSPGVGRYFGIHQSVIGEVGFTADTRVYGVAAGPWEGSCPCRTGRDLEQVQTMREHEQLEEAGCIAARMPEARETWLRFRLMDRYVYWELRLTGDLLQIGSDAGGVWRSLAQGRRPRTAENLLIQVAGDVLTVAVDGRRVLAVPGLQARRISAGIEMGPGWDRDRVTVLPARVRLPEHLAVGGTWQPSQPKPMVRDDLRGDGPLDRHVSSGRAWLREGQGGVRLTAVGARVEATHDKPNPGRTLHVIDWHENTADICVTVTPPARRPGEVHRGRGGVVLRSVDGNQLVVSTYLDDWYVGRSLSSFVTINGRELFYRAVWTNVGDRVTWGRPYTLRVSFDGDRYLARIDGEPVLFRRISDIVPGGVIFVPRYVGLAVNEEFGNDTGTVFTDLRIGALDVG